MSETIDHPRLISAAPPGAAAFQRLSRPVANGRTRSLWVGPAIGLWLIVWYVLIHMAYVSLAASFTH